MAADASIYGLQQQAPVRINTPFENLDVVMRARAAQDAARGLAEQRQAMAAEHRQKTAAAQQEAQQDAQYLALWQRKDPTTGQPVAPTFDESAATIGADRATKVHKGMEEVQKLKWTNQQEAAQGIAAMIDGVEAWPVNDRQTPHTTIRQSLIEKGIIKPGDMPETYNASWYAQKKREAMTAAQRAERDKPVAPIHIGQQLVKPNAEGVYEAVYTAPKEAPKPAALGSFEDYVDRFAKERGIPPQAITAGVIEQARKAYGQADDRVSVNVSGAPRTMTPTAEAGLVTRLAGMWDKSVKQSSEMRRQFNIMKAGVDRFDADPNGASQAILVTFQKLLDPESVVRESEFDRSREGMALKNRIAGYMERLTKGGAGVPKSELIQMVKTAEQFYERTKDAPAAAKKRLSAIGGRYNLPEELWYTAMPDDAPVGGAAAPTKIGRFEIVK